MGFEALTIQSTINSIIAGTYLLPAIQRELVWDTDQIEKLFDSLLTGYPIGSFLFWKVNGENTGHYHFYDFIRVYHERESPHPRRAIIPSDKDIIGVLDGQQRLTALYIALHGSYATKLRWKHYNDPNAYPKSHLYLNLSTASGETDRQYDFRFLRQEEVEQSQETHWFDIRRTLAFKEPYAVMEYLQDYGISANKFASQTLFALRNVIFEQQLISYYLETSQDVDRVLNIFIRINSGGTKLSYSDLLLSTATANWHIGPEDTNAHEEINKLVHDLNLIGDGFNFDKDFVLKACLVLADIDDIRYKVKNFVDNVSKIEAKWNDIRESLIQTVQLVHSFGFNDRTLSSSNALIPIAYYLLHGGLVKNYLTATAFEKDREAIRRWLVASLLKGTFGRAADTVLHSIRSVIENSYGGFPSQAIAAQHSKSPELSEAELEDLLDSKYGRRETFLLLSLLYPSLDFRNKFHEDHIFPQSRSADQRLKDLGATAEDIRFYRANLDYLPNLELQDETLGMEKSDEWPGAWLSKVCKGDVARKVSYCEANFWPNDDPAPLQFREFWEARRRELLSRLKLVLLDQEAEAEPV